jgi:valyl-tRNA synthetase
MVQSEGVFDTWFSSALWPFAILGWPEESDDIKEYYPTNVLSTARDIINLWVARMVFSGVSLVKKIPFTDVLIHATVITKDGQRMSKSLGTGIDPIAMVEKYGSDATRFGLAWQASELQDMRFGESDILAGKKFCNKVWNAARFILLMTDEENFEPKKIPSVLTEEDKNILAGLEKTIQETNQFLELYRFDQALQGIYHFFWHQFCDKYIEQAKIQLKEAKDETVARVTKQILLYVLSNSLKLLHPFIPFVTEKIYQSLPLADKKALIVEEWPE